MITLGFVFAFCAGNVFLAACGLDYGRLDDDDLVWVVMDPQ